MTKRYNILRNIGAKELKKSNKNYRQQTDVSRHVTLKGDNCIKTGSDKEQTLKSNQKRVQTYIQNASTSKNSRTRHQNV